MGAETIRRRHTRLTRCALWAGGVIILVLLLAWSMQAQTAWPTVAAILLLAAGLAAGDRWMRDESGVAVLCYHSINPEPNWLPWNSAVVGLESFRRQMRMLRRSGCTVLHTSDLIAARSQGRPLPPRPVVLHFDDGYLDTWVAVTPILRRLNLPATLFVSLDFIEPGNTPRPTLEDDPGGEPLTWQGYVNWAELKAMSASNLIDVQAHGVDHGRRPVGTEIVDRVSVENWRNLVWMQWSRLPGCKADWIRWTQPPAIPIGSPVRVNAPALAGPVWDDERGIESHDAYETRVRSDLALCRLVLETRLGKTIDIFCWPENGTSPRARSLAHEIGYHATTAGEGENRPTEDPRIISRMGVGDKVMGWRWPLADAVILYAAIRVFQGNYYWYFLLLGPAASRRLVRFFKRSARR